LRIAARLRFRSSVGITVGPSCTMAWIGVLPFIGAARWGWFSDAQALLWAISAARPSSCRYSSSCTCCVFRRKRGRLPDLPGLPEKPISSSAVASGMPQRLVLADARLGAREGEAARDGLRWGVPVPRTSSNYDGIRLGLGRRFGRLLRVKIRLLYRNRIGEGHLGRFFSLWRRIGGRVRCGARPVSFHRSSS
jgi:hypothetical protein